MTSLIHIGTFFDTTIETHHHGNALSIVNRLSLLHYERKNCIHIHAYMSLNHHQRLHVHDITLMNVTTLKNWQGTSFLYISHTSAALNIDISNRIMKMYIIISINIKSIIWVETSLSLTSQCCIWNWLTIIEASLIIIVIVYKNHSKTHYVNELILFQLMIMCHFNSTLWKSADVYPHKAFVWDGHKKGLKTSNI